MKVVTAVVNNPIFIELQYATLKKYMTCEYEFIVFNDAKDFPDFTNGNDSEMRQKIRDVCNKFNIKYVDIPNEYHKTNTIPSKRTADSMNFILEFQKQNPDEYLLLDSDMFLVDFFNIEKYRNYECGIVLQHRLYMNTYYLWNGLYYFNIPKMERLDLLQWDMTPYCDTGGASSIWLSKQTENEKIPSICDTFKDKNNSLSMKNYYIKYLPSGQWTEKDIPENIRKNKSLVNFLITNPRNINNTFFCELYDDCILHYRAGGNWANEGLDLHNNLAKKLKEVLLE